MFRTACAAISISLATLPACAGEPVRAAVPDRIVMPMAATFVPPLLGGRAGGPADGRLVVLGGDESTTFDVRDGSLPDGTSLAPGGELVGTFGRPGSYKATVAARAGDGRETTAVVEIEVAPAR